MNRRHGSPDAMAANLVVREAGTATMGEDLRTLLGVGHENWTVFGRILRRQARRLAPDGS